jgi:hypothetical protein
MKTSTVHRLAALAIALSATFSLVWAHASVAYPAPALASLMLVQACR